MVSTSDYESGCPGSSPEWVPVLQETRSLHRSYQSLHPSGGSPLVPEKLNIKVVIGACKLIDGCSLELHLATPSVASSGKCNSNQVNSIAWLYRGPCQKDSSNTLYYITLHYITPYITRWQSYVVECSSLWPSGIGPHLGWNRLSVWFLAVSDICRFFLVYVCFDLHLCNKEFWFDLIISHVHRAYDYLGPFWVLWVHMAWQKNCA